jgi:hypothetical protein
LYQNFNATHHITAKGLDADHHALKLAAVGLPGVARQRAGAGTPR